MSIKEALAKRPQPGEMVNETVPGLGNLKVKILSFDESAEMKNIYDAMKASLFEADGSPVFESGEDARQKLDTASGNALLQIHNKYNSVKLAEAEKN